MNARPADLERASRRSEIAGAALALAAFALGWWARVHTAFADPSFDVVRPEGLLKSDPALLYYFTERILEAGGGVPADFRADPRVLHPLLVDVPARFTVGQEFLAAWWHALFGRGEPLHVSCVKAMGCWASLTALCVFGLARELTRRPLAAGLAALLFALLPVDYRTIGFVLVREDFSLPWLALHLFLAARAVGRGSRAAALGSALALAVAVSTWHAMPFLVTLEALAVGLWFVRTGQNPLAGAGRVAAVVLIAAATLVPVLRATRFALSEPMLVVYALVAAGIAGPRLGRRRALGIGLAALGAGLAVSGLAWRVGGGRSGYGHVASLARAKLVHLGRLPADPRELSFDTRLMWQGPFETLDVSGWSQLSIYLTVLAALALVVWSSRILVRSGGSPCVAVVVLFATLSLPLAWLVARTSILPGLLAPVLVAAALQRWSAPRAQALLAGACLLQAAPFAAFLRDHRIGWYQPAFRQAEIARMVAVLPTLVPEGEAVVSDFVNSTAVLAHTRRPIVLQPKYEDRESRERARLFVEALFHGTPSDLAHLMRERFHARHLLLDRYTLDVLSRYLAGIPQHGPLPEGSAVALLLDPDAAPGGSVPGFRLLDRSPANIRQPSGQPSDCFRLYRLDDP